MRQKIYAAVLALLSAAAGAATWVPAASQSGCSANTWCKLGSGAGTAGQWSALDSASAPVAVLTAKTTGDYGPPRWLTDCAATPNDPAPSRIIVTLTIANTGGAPLTISGIYGTEIATVTPALPTTVAAGGSSQISVINNLCTFVTPTGTVYSNGGNLAF